MAGCHAMAWAASESSLWLWYFCPSCGLAGCRFSALKAFDTFGKILPRATAIASQISVIYLALTLACVLTYFVLGMNAFDATVHAMTTVATGGFANYDASFGVFSGVTEYAASVFMILAALPFVRYVQLINGNAKPLWRDSQIHVFLLMIAALVLVTVIALTTNLPHSWEQAFREALFNITSIISGTGYSSVNYMNWGGFLICVFFFVGLIGGCAGSTACSVKIFRYQLLIASIKSQLRRIRSPNGVFVPRYQGKKIDDDVLNSVMTFFVFFVGTLGVVAVLLGLTGLDFTTSVSGAATAIANVGPGLGDIIGPSGNFAPLNDTAKWILIAAMLIGRLELMTVYVIFTVAFWRA